MTEVIKSGEPGKAVAVLVVFESNIKPRLLFSFSTTFLVLPVVDILSGSALRQQ